MSETAIIDQGSQHEQPDGRKSSRFRWRRDANAATTASRLMRSSPRRARPSKATTIPLTAEDV